MVVVGGRGGKSGNRRFFNRRFFNRRFFNRRFFNRRFFNRRFRQHEDRRKQEEQRRADGHAHGEGGAPHHCLGIVNTPVGIADGAGACRYPF